MEKRFHNFKDPLVSFNEIIRFGAVLKPLPYAGFDTANFAGTQATISHTNDGFIHKLSDGSGNSDPTGIFLTPQLTTIHEDESVVVPVDFNVGNSKHRIDFLIYDHTYLDSEPGATGAYSVIKGSTSITASPALSNDKTQTIIGRFLIQPEAPDHSNTVYERANFKQMKSTILTPAIKEVHLSALFQGNWFEFDGDFTFTEDILIFLHDFEEGVHYTFRFRNKITDYGGLNGLIQIFSSDNDVIAAYTTTDIEINSNQNNLETHAIYDGTNWLVKNIVSASGDAVDISTKMDKAPVQWKALVLLNGWVAYGGSEPRWRVTQDNRLELGGDLDPTNATSGTFHILALGAQPEENMNVPIVNPRFTGVNTNIIMRLLLAPSGTCQVDPFDTGDRYSLDGVSIPLEVGTVAPIS